MEVNICRDRYNELIDMIENYDKIELVYNTFILAILKYNRLYTLDNKIKDKLLINTPLPLIKTFIVGRLRDEDQENAEMYRDELPEQITVALNHSAIIKIRYDTNKYNTFILFRFNNLRLMIDEEYNVSEVDSFDFSSIINNLRLRGYENISIMGSQYKLNYDYVYYYIYIFDIIYKILTSDSQLYEIYECNDLIEFIDNFYFHLQSYDIRVPDIYDII